MICKDLVATHPDSNYNASIYETTHHTLHVMALQYLTLPHLSVAHLMLHSTALQSKCISFGIRCHSYLILRYVTHVCLASRCITLPYHKLYTTTYTYTHATTHACNLHYTYTYTYLHHTAPFNPLCCLVCRLVYWLPQK